MKKLVLSLCLMFALGFSAAAQEHYSEGPVWRVTLVRVKPAMMDNYLSSLRSFTKPILDEEKKQGLILDYKVFLNETQAGTDDWDVAVAVEYKNHAALDGLAAKTEAIRDKVSSKQAAQDLAVKRVEVREVTSSRLMQEIFLK